ncbi:MAG: ABC transporter permease [Actinobacteria bacterium]|nr:ABC transporter permease [Actinomycetota bacterium]
MRAAIGQGTIRVTQRRVFVSEWTKLRSVRSTRWALLAAVVLTIGLAAITSAVVASQWAGMPAGERANFNALDPSMIGFTFAQLAIGVLGVLLISAEYSTGMIRSSFCAVPRRLPVLWAKAGIYAAVTLVLMVPAALVAFFVSQSILSGQHIQIALSQAGVARAVIGAGAYLTVLGVFALGLGAIIRNTAGAITALAGILFVLPGLMFVLPSSWNHAVSPYLPSNAGQRIMSIVPDSNALSPWVGFAVFCGYAAVVMAIAALLMSRRDT